MWLIELIIFVEINMFLLWYKVYLSINGYIVYIENSSYMYLYVVFVYICYIMIFGVI